MSFEMRRFLSQSVLGRGGLRRETLKGCENLTKRHYAATPNFNLSLLLCHVFGVGTAKQWLARRMGRPFAVIDILVGVLLAVILKINSHHKCMRAPRRTFGPQTQKPLRLRFVPDFSTGC
jgi:hypothetical protein